MFSADAITAMQADAVDRYPEESCGFVVDGVYRRYRNVHPDPDRAFRIAPQAWAAASRQGEVEAVIHSHPSGRVEPSAADMQGQIDSAVPWAIVITDGEVAGAPWAWGDRLEPPPLIGRPFRHGPSGTDGKGDCYALIRDWYRQERGVVLKDFPRDNDWWRDDKDLYSDGFGEAGFRQLAADEVEPGDVFLGALPAGGAPRGVPHHGGIVLGNNLILHHLTGRLSREEPLGRWIKYVTHWLRYDP